MAQKVNAGSDIFYACHTGNLDLVRFLVEECEEEVNQRDKWDSTPLYYASLCGHRPVVEYLLKQGARCEPNTFDGERSLYGALNDNIRHLLRSWKVADASAGVARNPYIAFLTQLQEREPADVRFLLQGREFRAHRCVLAARSPLMARRFAGRWRQRSVVELRQPTVVPEAFQALLDYLYTARLNIPVGLLEPFERLAKQCGLRHALERVALMRLESEYLEASKPNVRIAVHALDPDLTELRTAFARLADAAQPADLAPWGLLPFPPVPRAAAQLPDVCFQVSGFRFPCHRAFFCARSLYFRALITNQACGQATVPFEGEEDDEEEDEGLELPLVMVQELDPEAFRLIVFYVYEEHLYLESSASDDTVLQLLDVAEMVLLPNLKRQLGLILEQRLDIDTSALFLRAARLYQLPRLERACVRLMAVELLAMCQRQDFAELVQEDAAGVRGRQETDSIEIVDQIRFQVGTVGAMETVPARLDALHEMLTNLGLEC